MRYARREGWQAVELPYVGERPAMWVLVPCGDRSPSDVLTPELLTAVGNGLTDGIVDLHLPRWDFDTSIELVPAMQALGVNLAFDPAADFSGITAAIIWIGMPSTGPPSLWTSGAPKRLRSPGLAFECSGPPRPDAVIHADRPFAFVIVDTEARTPLFLSRSPTRRPERFGAPHSAGPTWPSRGDELEEDQSTSTTSTL